MTGPSTPAAYFDGLWAGSDDPWDHAGRFYETRKYDLTAAALDRPRFDRAFEPGCGIGLLTARLAARCDRLVAWDRHPRAVELTAARTSSWPGVEGACRQLSVDRPTGPFDLIVVSEVLYYLTAPQVDDVMDTLTDVAADGAQLVTVHYRRPVSDHALAGDEVHARVLAAAGWARTGSYRDDDFRLDSLRRT